MLVEGVYKVYALDTSQLSQLVWTVGLQEGEDSGAVWCDMDARQAAVDEGEAI